jgi:hypothetical protein
VRMRADRRVCHAILRHNLFGSLVFRASQVANPEGRGKSGRPQSAMMSDVANPR